MDIVWWSVPVLGVLFNSSLYWLFKHYSVYWISELFLSDKDERKTVSAGDAASISAELVGCVVPTLNGIVGVIVMFETSYDTVNAKSAILIPWCHAAAWYFVAHGYQMYDVHCLRSKIYHLPLGQRMRLFLRSKQLYVFHHIFSFLFGYLIIVNTSLRHGKIDFYFAAIMIEELCNPFICVVKIMKVLGRDKSVYYEINGLLLAISYFLFRIVNQPFVLMVYAAQYHSWNILRAMASLRLVCYFTILAQYSFQVYWFTAIAKLVAKGLKERHLTAKKVH